MSQFEVLLSRDVKGALADCEAIRRKTKGAPHPLIALATFPRELDERFTDRAVAWFDPAIDLRNLEIYVGPSIGGIDGRWEAALIQTAAKISASGRVWVMRSPEPGFWARVGLSRMQRGRRADGMCSLVYRQTDRGPGSIVEFLVDDYFARKLHVSSNTADPSSDHSSDRKLGLSPQNFEACRELSHLSDVVSRDASVVSRIVREMLPESVPLNLMDVGGRNGFLLGEIALEFERRVQRALLVESNSRYVRTAARLNRWLKKNGACGLQIQQSAPDEVEWPEQYCNVLMFLRSHWKMQKSEVHFAFQSAWKALQPGGVLVICAPPGRFSLKDKVSSFWGGGEPVSYLKNFGKVWLFSSQGKAGFHGTWLGGQPLFHVVQKNA